MRLLIRTVIGGIYAIICFISGEWMTVNIFHNPLNLPANVYFTVVSLLIGIAAATFTVNDLPKTSPPEPQNGALPTKDDV